jgi:hypothetical protein
MPKCKSLIAYEFCVPITDTAQSETTTKRKVSAKAKNRIVGELGMVQVVAPQHQVFIRLVRPLARLNREGGNF